MENNIIPKNISFYGLLSGQFILFAVFIGLFCKHYYLCLFGIALYITTMIHWSNIKYDTVFYLDVLFTITTILLITFYYAIYFFKIKYRNIWFIIIMAVTIIFSLNEYFYFTYIENNINALHPKLMQINIFIHILFLHILAPITYIYCSYMSL
jgi:hypothetical protein